MAIYFSDLLQRCGEQLPERFGGIDLEALARGMGREEGRSETHHIHARILAEDDGALQSGVVSLYRSLFACLLLVDLFEQIENLAVEDSDPSRRSFR